MLEHSFQDHFAATAVSDCCAVCSQPRLPMHFFFEGVGTREAIIGFDASKMPEGRSRVAGLYTTVHLVPLKFCSLECLRDYFLHKVEALEEQIRQLATESVEKPS